MKVRTMPRLLDLYCCQGGASRGYADAGFDVYGNDLHAQPRYPYMFTRGDALLTMRRLLSGDDVPFGDGSGRIEWLALADFSAIHASPPCQLYSLTHRINRSDFPDLIDQTRALLMDTGLPYVIENVVEAREKLIDPEMLCGAMFGIETYRHRLFETDGFNLLALDHPEHVARTTKHVVGNFSGVDRAREVMAMPWANRDGLREAIPPAYSAYVGRQLITQIEQVAA
jgi:DNA (cytosine-5)-methyltransferase 1